MPEPFLMSPVESMYPEPAKTQVKPRRQKILGMCGKRRAGKTAVKANNDASAQAGRGEWESGYTASASAFSHGGGSLGGGGTKTA